MTAFWHVLLSPYVYWLAFPLAAALLLAGPVCLLLEDRRDRRDAEAWQERS